MKPRVAQYCGGERKSAARAFGSALARWDSALDMKPWSSSKVANLSWLRAIASSRGAHRIAPLRSACSRILSSPAICPRSFGAVEQLASNNGADANKTKARGVRRVRVIGLPRDELRA